MMNKTSLGLFAIALASGACTTMHNDDIWMPPGGDGKADSYTTIRGKDIPSQFVDPNKYYMIGRNIANLSTVGALDADMTSLAKRVDGIIANLPADGKMELAELVRMENPTVHKSLFPGEQAALPKLWKLVEAPDSNDTVYGPRDNFGVVDGSIAPTAAIPPATLAISSLNATQQAAASRLENLYNSDNDTTTVSLSDLAMGIANPASFTPTEEATFPTIQAVFRTQAVAQGAATLDLSPGPGTATIDATLGPTTFHITSALKIAEQRVLYGSGQQLAATMTATQLRSSTIDVPTGAQVLVMDEGSATETVFGAGAVPGLLVGQYVFEVWQQGQRAFATNAELPTTVSTTPISLNDKLDYTLTSALLPLNRNVVDATVTPVNTWYQTYTVDYSYDTTAMPMPSGANSSAITATTTPTLTIPVGRYSFPQSNAVFYVFSSNVVWVSQNGAMVRMVPQGNSGQAPTRLIGLNNGNLTFDTTSNQFYCGSCQPNVNVRLDASMRDI